MLQPAYFLSRLFSVRILRPALIKIMGMPLLVIIINTILCVVGIIPAFAIQMGTVMGGAAVGAGQLGHFIAVAGYIFPAMPIISIIGSWIAYLAGLSWLAIVFVALPWVYLLMLGVCLAFFFLKGNRQNDT